jgi:Phosphatidylserine decarboxylase
MCGMAGAPRPAGVRRRAGTGQNAQPQRSASWPTDQRSTCRLVRYPPIHKAGRLWTVNWHALLNKPDILFRNERHINILDTANFGRMGFVEIGALSVGRIVQVHGVDAPIPVARRNPSFVSAARRLPYSASRDAGVRPPTSLRTPRRASRRCCALASRRHRGSNLEQAWSVAHASLISRRLFRVSNQRGFSDVGGQEGRWSF